MRIEKSIALVAHDHKKKDLIEWVKFNSNSLKGHKIICTGTTGKLVEEALSKEMGETKITILKSGPLGGDQQLGAMIIEEKVDIIIFFWDPMQPLPHDVDIKALLRIAVLYNIPTACNRSTADFIISSSLFHQAYYPQVENYSDYINRNIEK